MPADFKCRSAPEYSHSVSFTLFGGAGLGFAVP